MDLKNRWCPFKSLMMKQRGGGFYCENPDSTNKQEVDVLLFRLIYLVKRFYFFNFNIQNI